MLRHGAFSIPPAPLLLTLSGLIPFIACAVIIATQGANPILQGQTRFLLLAYSAIILSFLGGVRWGLEITPSQPGETAPRLIVLGGSVLGALVGWAALGVSLLNTRADQGTLFLAIAVALVAHWSWDVSSRKATPAWYDGLRTIATVGAAMSLIVGWWFS